MIIKYFKICSILYLISTLAVLFSRVFDVFWLSYPFKTALMPILAFLFYMNTKKALWKFSKALLAALFFSWLGDIFLLFQEQQPRFFVFGLAAFLLAHLSYSYAFFHTNRPKKTSEIMHHPWLMLPFLVYGFGFVYLLKDYLGNMLLPVSLYSMAISTMTILSTYRYGKVSYRSYTLVFSGVLFFLLSDSLIAVNKFYTSIPIAGFWVMLTYTIAQYLIVYGAIIQEKGKVRGMLQKSSTF